LPDFLKDTPQKIEKQQKIHNEKKLKNTKKHHFSSENMKNKKFGSYP
jgi:hypothetical protein